jgi:polo-like kinase 1
MLGCYDKHHFSYKELLVKYVDFSSKYGIGYKLTNGSYGVLFNDSTKIILDPNLFHFDYIQRPSMPPPPHVHPPTSPDIEEIQSHTFFSYPTSLSKKVILLQHFKSFLDGNQKFKPITFSFAPQNAPQRSTEQQPLTYLKKWKSSSKKALLFRLTNKMIHTVFLNDHSELVIDSNIAIVTYVNSLQQMRSLPLHSDIEGQDKSMFKRLQIAKEMLMQSSTHKPRLESTRLQSAHPPSETTKSMRGK